MVQWGATAGLASFRCVPWFVVVLCRCGRHGRQFGGLGVTRSAELTGAGLTLRAPPQAHGPLFRRLGRDGE